MDTQVDQLTSWWANRQQSPLAPTRSFPRMPWEMVALVFAGILASLLVWQWVSLTKSRSPSALTRQEERAGWCMVLPWVLGFVLFMLGPSVLSLLLSVARWKGIDTLGTAEFVGLGNYREILGADPPFGKASR